MIINLYSDGDVHFAFFFFLSECQKSLNTISHLPQQNLSCLLYKPLSGPSRRHSSAMTRLLPDLLLPPTTCPWYVMCNKTTVLGRRWYQGTFCAGRCRSTDKRPRRSPGAAWWWSCKAESDRYCPARSLCVSGALLWQPWRRTWRGTGQKSALRSPGTYEKFHIKSLKNIYYRVIGCSVLASNTVLNGISWELHLYWD